MEFPGFNPEKKDVMGLFWKNCFYKHIEEFRKSIKKLKGQLDVNRFNQKLANHMSRLCQEFIAFLSDSAKFIQKLMADVSTLKRVPSNLKSLLNYAISSSWKERQWRLLAKLTRTIMIT